MILQVLKDTNWPRQLLSTAACRGQSAVILFTNLNEIGAVVYPVRVGLSMTDPVTGELSYENRTWRGF